MEFQLLQMCCHMPYPWDLFDNQTTCLKLLPIYNFINVIMISALNEIEAVCFNRLLNLNLNLNFIFI